ncbi:hypothetical protein [Xenorhabdus bovienii]|uniref:hypothetical protein n=1 Tax=Xenorhabdus bovienii TaxID=40576 RepID=UPI0023B2B457|nr:hypothetical protein [Xenorhabdus bovienii]
MDYVRGKNISQAKDNFRVSKPLDKNFYRHFAAIAKQKGLHFRVTLFVWWAGGI